MGRSGIEVSPLGFGTLTISPLQAGLPVSQGADVIRAALDRGVNLIDTAEIYETYPYIRQALQGRDTADILVISKSYAYTAPDMRRSVEEALRQTGLERLGGFLLHEQESAFTLRGHREALDELVRLRERGLIRVIGISTHAIAAVHSASLLPEIDVIHPLYNREGLGIMDGTAQDMLAAIADARSMGKGIYAMKALGGGHLIGNAEEALRQALSIPHFASVAVGMKSVAEVEYNCAIMNDEAVPDDVRAAVTALQRRLHVESWCRGCGRCVARCPFGALSLSEGRAVVREEICMHCGYCAAVCPDFCLKVV